MPGKEIIVQSPNHIIKIKLATAGNTNKPRPTVWYEGARPSITSLAVTRSHRLGWGVGAGLDSKLSNTCRIPCFRVSTAFVPAVFS